jgi:hypothetical protein
MSASGLGCGENALEHGGLIVVAGGSASVHHTLIVTLAALHSFLRCYSSAHFEMGSHS